MDNIKEEFNSSTLTEPICDENITLNSLEANKSLSSKFKEKVLAKPEEILNKTISDLSTRINKTTGPDQEELIELKREFLKTLGLDPDKTINYINIDDVSLPHGFRLEVIAVNPKLTEEQIQAVRDEFNDEGITEHAVKIMAETQEADLKKHGICQQAIDIAKKGLMIKALFPYSRDHILEIADSKNFSLNKEKDEGNKYKKTVSFISNHLANICILPDSIHHLKNTIKAIQLKIYDNSIHPRAFVSLIPTKESRDKGLLCAEQPKNSKYRVKPKTQYEIANCLANYIKQETISSLLKSESGVQVISSFKDTLELMFAEATKPSDDTISKLVDLRTILKDKSIQNMCIQICSKKSDASTALRNTLVKIKNYEDNIARKSLAPKKIKLKNKSNIDIKR